MRLNPNLQYIKTRQLELEKNMHIKIEMNPFENPPKADWDEKKHAIEIPISYPLENPPAKNCNLSHAMKL